MKLCLCISMFLLAGLCACAQSRRSEWDNLDYTRVYQRNRGYENDNLYQPPSVLNCVNDDLYNCNP